MPVDRMAQLLASTATVKIATAGGPVSPWLAAAFFAEDGLFELRIMVEGRGKTFTNLFIDPHVAVMLENGDAFSLFAQGSGLAEPAPAEATDFQAALSAKTPACRQLVHMPGQIPVRIRIQRWLMTDVSAGWLPARELYAPLRPLAEAPAQV